MGVHGKEIQGNSADGDRGVRIKGWIHELREWKMKNQQQEDERLQATSGCWQWFFEARLGLWRNKGGFIGVLGDAERAAENAMQEMVPK